MNRALRLDSRLSLLAALGVLALGAGLLDEGRAARSGGSWQPPGAPEVAPLGLRPPLPSAGEVLGDHELNPGHRELADEERARVQALIDEESQGLAELQEEIGPARAWAELRIGNGDYELVEDGDTGYGGHGFILVRVAESSGLTMDVQIHPGECAELDVLTAEIDAFLQDGRVRLRELIGSLENKEMLG